MRASFIGVLFVLKNSVTLGDDTFSTESAGVGDDDWVSASCHNFDRHGPNWEATLESNRAQKQWAVSLLEGFVCNESSNKVRHSPLML